MSHSCIACLVPVLFPCQTVVNISADAEDFELLFPEPRDPVPVAGGTSLEEED